jgi:hypothetical protein
VIVTDERGRLVVEATSATQGLHGKLYARREPVEGCPANTVRALGAFGVGDERTGVENELVVETTTFGAIPSGDEWAGASSTTFNVGEFARLFRPLNEAEAAVLALESAAEAEAATKVSAKRASPWSVVG